MIGPFYIQYDSFILYWYDAFSILVVSTKRRYSSSLKKVFVFQKIYFKVKVLKTFKIPTDCHIKTSWSVKRRAILKIPIQFFRRTYGLSVGFKMKLLRKSVFQCKSQHKFCRKTFWKEQSSIFTICLMNHIFKTYVLFNTLDNGMFA